MFGFGKKKKEDEKDNKEEEEKKEEEKEEEEDDDEESGEDAAVEDEDDFTLYPLEAQEWARNTLGDPSFSKYYQIAKQRSESDAIEMLTRRKWRATIKNIHFTNQDKEQDIFLKFSFGTNFRVSRRFVRSKGQVAGGAPSKAPAPGGKPSAPKRTFEWQVKGDVGVVLLTTVKRGVGKGVSVDFDDEFTFNWSGSYFDLFKKNLHVEVWDWNYFSPNSYLAMYERTLREICSDPMDQEWNIYTQIRKRGKVENVNVGSLKFTVIVEEVLDYTVKLSNWNCTLNVKEFMELENQSREMNPFVVFHLHHPIHTYWSKKRVVSKDVRVIVHDKMEYLKVNFGQLQEMQFKGTRLEMEQGEIFVQIYNATSSIATSLLSTPLAHCTIPLQAVMEIGVLSADLTKTTQKQGFLSKAGSFVGPRIRGATVVMSSFAQAAKEGSQSAIASFSGRKPKQSQKEKFTFREATLCGFVRGNLDVEVLSKRTLLDHMFCLPPMKFTLWREFAQVGEPNPPELRDYPPYFQSYLCVRIVNARGLFPADDTGFSDPYVVVRWGDQELKTRIVRETLRPDFQEDLTFLVRSNDPKHIKSEDLAKNPAILVNVMDFDPAGSSDMLGSAKVFLHQITGCGTVDSKAVDEEDEGLQRIPTRPMTSVYIRRRANPSAPLRPCTIQTRVFRQELRLQGLPPDFKSTVLVECFFRTWEGDLKERDARIRSLTHTDLVVLPPLKQLFLEKNTPCLCKPVFLFQKNALNALQENASGWTLQRSMCESSRPLAKKLRSRNPATAATEEASVPSQSLGETFRQCFTVSMFSKRLQEEWSLPSRSELYRMEMEQEPPRPSSTTNTTAALAKKPHSEKRRLHTCKDAENKDISLAEFLQSDTLECKNFLAKDIFGQPHWLPQYLHPLTPPKAMIRDLEERKYMVILSSKLPNAQYEAAQMVKAIEFWDLDEYHMAGFSPSTWMDPGTLLTMKKGDVKAHALLLCNLFLGLQTDAYVCLGYARSEPTVHDIMGLREKAREERWPSKQFKFELERLRGKPKPYVWVMTRESTGEEYGEAYKGVGSVKFWDVTQGSYYAPLPGRWKGQNDEELFRIFKSSAKTKTSKQTVFHREESMDHDESGMPSSLAPSTSLPPAAAVLDSLRDLERRVVREEDLLHDDFDDREVHFEEVFGLGMVGSGNNSAQASFDDISPIDTEGHAIETTTATLQQDNSLPALQSSGWASRIKELLSERQFNRDEMIRESLPFTEIIAVFNHKNLWVNAQRYLHPAEITYDFGPDDRGWVAVLTKDASEHIQSFYPPKTLSPKLTQDRVSDLRTRVEDELEAGMTNFRSSRSISTRFAGREMKKLVRKYLETVHKFDELDFSRRNGWESNQFVAGSVGFELQLMKSRLLEAIMNTVPPGFAFRIGTAQFSSGDPTDIRKKVLSHTWRSAPKDWIKEAVDGKERDPSYVYANRKPALHEENHDGREVFSVAASVFAYFNQIVVVKFKTTGKYASSSHGQRIGRCAFPNTNMLALVQCFENYQKVKDECSQSEVWSPYAEMFADNGFVDHHGLGRFETKQGVLEYISKSIAPFGTMTFPIDWVAFDVKSNAVVFQVQNAFPTPPFDENALPFQFPNWTRLVFSSTGKIMSEETVYNPERDAKRTLKKWRSSGGQFRSKEQLKYKYSQYPTKSNL